MKVKLNLQTACRHFDLPDCFELYLDAFINELSDKGYTALTVRGYYDSIAHFGIWFNKKSFPLKKLNDETVAKFAQHRCYCIRGRKGHKVSYKYVRRIKRFIFYLRQKGIIPAKLNLSKSKPHPHLEKFIESLQCRGLSPNTIKSYAYSMHTLLPLLSNNTKKYNAVQVRNVICNAAKQKSRCEVKKLTTALRSYLRFLTTESVCCPDLDAAVPTIAEWKLSSLPKYITTQEVERVIKVCDIHTQQGIRDRAIILLLSRLGLRAGDVSNMLLEDINWSKGTVRVTGKGRIENNFPLPQEVGDAILTYIEKVRPCVTIDKLFLCLNAPHRPFSRSSNVSGIVRASLRRAGITDPPSHGAHLLRHSAATNMLRQGATLEAVSVMLRHHSLDMTVYYAKVDISRLKRIAQPWPEGASC